MSVTTKTQQYGPLCKFRETPNKVHVNSKYCETRRKKHITKAPLY